MTSRPEEELCNSKVILTCVVHVNLECRLSCCTVNIASGSEQQWCYASDFGSEKHDEGRYVFYTNSIHACSQPIGRPSESDIIVCMFA